MKFLKNVMQTMKATTWPTARENRKDTTTVILMTVFFAAFFAIVDYLVQLGLKLFV
ncbi:preprotein translocase subunit SecE [Ligilactobacillus salitolerans]|uniref:Preprotein translocase subunit SecE n=1 Tax=Ligilactobacillus salitolerans TaxID=1808352 RepID=A0A401IUT6_9LACO|nr:preprotein translocase subunit SecE [Ligilactobacillus salitolerans]GBG95289.1 preprotein translocase subunit SecE [Ligilactobacillus salitolerans]